MTSAISETYDVTDAPTVGTAVAVRPTAAQSIQEARAAMALKDDEQILSSMMGAIMKEWVYEFSIGGKTVTGISVTGAAEIARLRAEAGFPIRFPVVTADELMQNGKRGLRVTVIARDQRTGGEAPAMVFEAYDDDKGRPNAFPERKALSKARRNAILELIPEQQCLQLIQAAKDSAAGRVGRRPQVQQRAGRREVPAEVTHPTQTAESHAGPQFVGGKDPYGLEESTPEQMTLLARLVAHPCNVHVTDHIARRIEQGKYRSAKAVLTAIEAMKRAITDAGDDPEKPETWAKGEQV